MNNKIIPRLVSPKISSTIPAPINVAPIFVSIFFKSNNTFALVASALMLIHSPISSAVSGLNPNKKNIRNPAMNGIINPNRPIIVAFFFSLYKIFQEISNPAKNIRVMNPMLLRGKRRFCSKLICFPIVGRFIIIPETINVTTGGILIFFPR